MMEALAMEPDHREGVARCAMLIGRAIRTHDALPNDREQKLANWPDYPQEAEDAYGYTEERAPRFSPTPTDVSNMLPVMAWLAWLSNQNNGRRDLGLLFKRARKQAWWRIAQHHGMSERQVKRWYDGAVTAIYEKHSSEVWTLRSKNV